MNDKLEVAKTKLAFAAQTLGDFADFVEADRISPSEIGMIRYETEHKAVTNYWLMVSGFIKDAMDALEEVEI